MKKRYVISDFCCFVLMTAGVVLLWNIYALTGGSTLGVIFGAVNSSVWEKAKCLSIIFLLGSLVQLLCLRPSFHCFAAAKTFGLCIAMVSFIAIDSFFKTDFFALSAALILGLSGAFLLHQSRINLRELFAPACFLLMLIYLMTFSFTVFPPMLGIFRDPFTGYYGIIPDYFDLAPFSLG